uniref:Uncharacterized protein n=1 Tax=Rhizophora mucronata TaxID=61149 RepID=A0A2P2PRY4_RHIMU
MSCLTHMFHMTYILLKVLVLLTTKPFPSRHQAQMWQILE